MLPCPCRPLIYGWIHQEWRLIGGGYACLWAYWNGILGVKWQERRKKPWLKPWKTMRRLTGAGLPVDHPNIYHMTIHNMKHVHLLVPPMHWTFRSFTAKHFLLIHFPSFYNESSAHCWCPLRHSTPTHLKSGQSGEGSARLSRIGPVMFLNSSHETTLVLDFFFFFPPPTQYCINRNDKYLLRSPVAKWQQLGDSRI